MIWLRVYVGREPFGGHHPGYRGPSDKLQRTTYGVRVVPGSEFLSDKEWVPVEVECLVPWHRVDLIEFERVADE